MQPRHRVHSKNSSDKVLRVYARRTLTCGLGEADDSALLLEGSWPAESRIPARQSLDDAIDGRFAWIDREAAEIADHLAKTDDKAGTEAGQRLPSALYLNALAMRYYLVKLLRLTVYFRQVQPLAPGQQVELAVSEGRDEDYAEVFEELCRDAGAVLKVSWHQANGAAGRRFPSNGPWRRLAQWLLGRRGPADDETSCRRVVLCGNPRLLDPVCRELLRRGTAVWWLYDRFAVKSWLQWQSTVVGQLVCDSAQGRHNRLPSEVPDQLPCHGIDLAPALRRWLSDRLVAHGPRQTRLVERIDEHFRRVQPDAVVLDEDATPMARAAVAMARRHGVSSFVVQHGVPYCRFGYSPLAADRILTWGQSSAEALIDWGVPVERIRVVGSPQHEGWSRNRRSASGSNGKARVSAGAQKGPSRQTTRLRFDAAHLNVPPVPYIAGDAIATANDLRFDVAEPGAAHVAHLRAGSNHFTVEAIRPPRILLLTTVPPRDERPDAVSLGLTSRSYAAMIRTAFATVADIHGAELTVKIHPRTAGDPVVEAIRTEFPMLATRIVHEGPLPKWLAEADCVLSCLSSAGIEAALTGVPVIQLVPSGASEFPSHEKWGLVGSAGNECELQRLLAEVLVEGRRVAAGQLARVFADPTLSAARRIVDEVLTSVPRVEEPAIESQTPNEQRSTEPV